MDIEERGRKAITERILPDLSMGLADGVIKSDARAASRLLSLIEDGDRSAWREIRALFPHRADSYVMGLTGPPGGGKSTIADRLIDLYRREGRRIGILAVDPSSPFSGGAILGDRIRMQRHATDRGVFIRSMASRRCQGGLSRATADAVIVLRAFGCDIIIVETVGVGQSEVDIGSLAYTTVLVCGPASGDKIQAIKAGVLEIADVVALNKADLPGADHAARELEMILRMGRRDGWDVPLIRTIALSGAGIEDLRAAVERHRNHLEQSGSLAERKRELEKKRLMRLIRERAIEKALRGLPDEGEVDRYMPQLESGAKDPYSIAEEITRNSGLEG